MDIKKKDNHSYEKTNQLLKQIDKILEEQNPFYLGAIILNYVPNEDDVNRIMAKLPRPIFADKTLPDSIITYSEKGWLEEPLSSHILLSGNLTWLNCNVNFNAF